MNRLQKKIISTLLTGLFVLGPVENVKSQPHIANKKDRSIDEILNEMNGQIKDLGDAIGNQLPKAINAMRLATIIEEIQKLFEQGKFQEAIPLSKEALLISDNIKNDDLVIEIRSLIATLYMAQGEYSEAESLYQKSLKNLQSRFSTNHPRVVEKMGALASLYSNQERYSEAEILCKKNSYFNWQPFEGK
jgi:tetratricopeptide (TPR) repeat protein